jgi:sulfite exporter TauE/SafE
MLDKAVGWMRSLTEAGIALIALAVVLQIIWPGAAAIPFIGVDIVGNVLALVAKLGAEGLVGLIAVWVLWGIYNKGA